MCMCVHSLECVKSLDISILKKEKIRGNGNWSKSGYIAHNYYI